MSFFVEDADAAEQPDEPQPMVEPDPWDGPPEGEVPAVLPVAALLGATGNAAVVLAGVRVFSSGVELSVEARLRRGDLAEDDWDDLLDRARGLGGRRSRRASQGRLRVGVALADGRKVVTDGPIDDGEGSAPSSRLVQLGGSGSGSDRSWVSSWTYWLWPVPPDGPLTVVTSWPQLGLAEAGTTIDGSDLSAIARRARPIWADADPMHTGDQPSWSISFGS